MDGGWLQPRTAWLYGGRGLVGRWFQPRRAWLYGGGRGLVGRWFQPRRAWLYGGRAGFGWSVGPATQGVALRSAGGPGRVGRQTTAVKCSTPG